jgi:hypothetical protein
MKDFKNSVNEIDRKLDTGFGQTLQEEPEEGYNTMGPVSTFRTEMMSNNGMPNQPPSI